jgi:hypothetical protein
VKFAEVLWLESKDDKKGKLYLVVSARNRDLFDMLAPDTDLCKKAEALKAIAAAAVKEAHKAPVKNPVVVLVNGDRMAGVSVKLLQDIATAPPAKRPGMFLPTWVFSRAPKEAKPLQ